MSAIPPLAWVILAVGVAMSLYALATHARKTDDPAWSATRTCPECGFAITFIHRDQQRAETEADFSVARHQARYHVISSPDYRPPGDDTHVL